MDLITSYLKSAIEIVTGKGTKARTYESVVKYIEDKDIPVVDVLREVFILSTRDANVEVREYRNSISYYTIKLSKRKLLYSNDKSTKNLYLNSEIVRSAIESTNRYCEIHMDMCEKLFKSLSIRNLSGLVGEMFSEELEDRMSDVICKNKHQDGSPDLCVMSPDSRHFLKENRHEDGSPNLHKSIWSPFPFGGIEVKATCGSVSSEENLDPTDSRLDFIQGVTWHAHHQQTNNLLGLYWDFINDIPTILAAFYCNGLDTVTGPENRHWRTTSKPDDDSRATSATCLGEKGMRLMGVGRIVLPEDPELRGKIMKKFKIPEESESIEEFFSK